MSEQSCFAAGGVFGTSRVVAAMVCINEGGWGSELTASFPPAPVVRQHIPWMPQQLPLRSGTHER